MYIIDIFILFKVFKFNLSCDNLDFTQCVITFETPRFSAAGIIDKDEKTLYISFEFAYIIAIYIFEDYGLIVFRRSERPNHPENHADGSASNW
jgi:hypothetical protein